MKDDILLLAMFTFFVLLAILMPLIGCTELGTQGARHESSRALWEAGDRLQNQGQAMMLESRLQMMNAAIMAPHH